MSKANVVYNQISEGTSDLYFTNVPYIIGESEEVSFTALTVNILRWNISGIEIPIIEDRYMTTTQQIPVSDSNVTGTLDVDIALDEYFDNYHIIWMWAQAYRKSERRRSGGSPYGKEIMRKSYCDYAEIPILNNNNNESIYIQLEKVKIKGISGISFGSYINKAIVSKVTFVFNDINIVRTSKKIAATL